MYVEPAQKQPNWRMVHQLDRGHSGWSDAMQTRNPLRVLAEHGRGDLLGCVRGAMGVAASLPGGAAAWKRFQDGIVQMSVDTGKAPNWNGDPTWAIVPRVK